MRIKNIKRTLFIYKPYECAAVEEYLENMSETGWLLKSVTGSIFKFKKIEPRKIKYSVDVLSKVSVFDHKDTDVALEYREYCQAAGWTYVCQTGKIQIFYTEEDKEIIPIHTDETEKFKIVFKASVYNVVIQFLIAIIWIFNLSIQLFWENTAFLLAYNLTLVSTVAMVFLVCINIIEVSSFFCWTIKARGKLKENKFMPYNSYKQLRRKNIFIKVYSLITITMVLKLFVFNNTENKEFNIYLLLTMLIPIIIMICTQWLINKKRYSRNTNMGITIGSTVVSIYLMLMLIGAIAFSSITKDDKNEVITDKASLTLMDFGYKENNYESPHITLNKSILASGERYYYGDDNTKLSYEILQSQYPWVIKFHENRLISRLNNYGFDLKEKKTNLPSNIKVYSEGKEKDFILVSEDKVVDITKEFSDISEKEFLENVYRLLFDRKTMQ